MLLITGGTLVVALAVGLVVARRAKVSRQKHNPDAERLMREWSSDARGLSWRERWTLYRTTACGRAAARPLASLAIERAEAMRADFERSMERGSTERVMWVLLRYVFGFNVLIGIANVVIKGGTGFLWVASLALVGFIVALAATPLRAKQARLFTRSIEINRRNVL